MTICSSHYAPPQSQQQQHAALIADKTHLIPTSQELGRQFIADILLHVLCSVDVLQVNHSQDARLGEQGLAAEHMMPTPSIHKSGFLGPLKLLGLLSNV